MSSRARKTSSSSASQPAGRIIGRVLDAAGAPVPNVDVAIPQTGGFFWVYADEQGNFEFSGLALGKYDLSSPAPPHEDPFDGGAAARSLATASQDEILATIGEAFAAFTGVNNPLLNGDGANFNPSDWGVTEGVTLDSDGDTVIADVQFLGRSTIGGTVINGQGVPIGARVRLTGVGPSLTGARTTVIRGERDTDPALGTFLFDDQALVGDWGLQAASPFFPVVISLPGRTTDLAPDDIDNVLQFPAVSETNGSLSGIVLLPDGVTPAGANIKVQISFGPDFIIRTGANGRFATQAGTFTLPAIDGEGRPGIGYTVTATDETNDATGRATVTVLPSQVNQVTVRLLGRGDGYRECRPRRRLARNRRVCGDSGRSISKWTFGGNDRWRGTSTLPKLVRGSVRRVRKPGHRPHTDCRTRGFERDARRHHLCDARARGHRQRKREVFLA